MCIENMSILNPFSPRDSSYSGKDSYRYVERVLRGEKNLLIVSPFIDDYYARYLISHSGGKRIRILSSSMQPAAARRLRGRDLGPAAKFTFLVAGLDAAFYLLRMHFLPFFIVSFAAAALLVAASLRGNRNISLRVPRDFVHAKMYVGDSVAVEGSANLTWAGMHKNVEHIDVIYDRKRIGELQRQFRSLWDSA
jgi:phosphatidylserine/phosphatidylglycerophosphate/cardiolipin synthase-like enzyme